MASDVQQYILHVDKNKYVADAVAVETARKLESKQVTLIAVIQSLGEYVNSEDAIIRSKTVQYLSAVVGAVPRDFLSIQQVQVLCEFLCSRTEDGGAVGGLKTLAGLRRFGRDPAKQTARAILVSFQDLQIRPQSQRHEILELLHDLMSSHRSALQDLQMEFVIGITDLVSGEKDPRNLMIIFSMLKAVMVEWDISNYTEPVFDSVFCYFPITFRPPPNDPYGITAQDLKLRVRECLAANSLFAPFAFPQLLDKLDSGSADVKKDVLQTLTTCASNYAASTVANYSITLWDSIKYEILNVQEEAIADEALATLQAIAIKLSHGLTSIEDTTALARYLKAVTKECNESLREPEHKQAKPAAQILSSVATASSVAFYLVIKAVMPSLLTIYQAADGMMAVRALLEIIVQLFDASIIVYDPGVTKVSEAVIENPLCLFKDQLFEMYSKALMSLSREETSLRLAALRGLLRQCQIRGFLDNSEVGLVIQYMNETYLDNASNNGDELRDEAISALEHISRLYPQQMIDTTIPTFISRLPDLCQEEQSLPLLALQGLARLGTQEQLFAMTVRRLLTRLDVTIHDGRNTVAYPESILIALTYIFRHRNLSQDPNLGEYVERIVHGLVSTAAVGASNHEQATLLNHPTNLEALGRLAGTLVRALDEHKQTAIGMRIFTLSDNSFSPVPFREQAVQESERSNMLISTYLLAAVRPLAIQSYLSAVGRKLPELIQELVELSITENVPSIRLTLLRQLALLVNRDLPSLVKSGHQEEYPAYDRIETLLSANDTSIPHIQTAFWIAKALVLRLEGISNIIPLFINLLRHSEHGPTCARGFSVLLSSDEIIAPENGAVIRKLAKQRVFSLCISQVSLALRQVDVNVKANYLIALSGILRNTSTEIMATEIETLLPLLLQSLDLEGADVKAATIESLTVMVRLSPAVVAEHASSLVASLLQVASNPTQNASRVRLVALKCLGSFPGSMSDSALLPHRSKVTYGLRRSLDDRKRDVRVEAVECRARWTALDEVDED